MRLHLTQRWHKNDTEVKHKVQLWKERAPPYVVDDDCDI